MKVFISYSQDSDAHKDKVRAFTDRLIADGIDTSLDQYIHGTPDNGWRRWMEEQVEEADFVLCIFTETYKRRWDGKEDPGRGLGAIRESIILDQMLYETGHLRKKIIPVIFSSTDKVHIPYVLGDMTHYVYERDFDKLYFYITNQPEFVKPPLGGIRKRTEHSETENRAEDVVMSTPKDNKSEAAEKQPTRIYIAYVQEDKEYCDMLLMQLQGMVKTRQIEIWSDQQLVAGEDWRSRKQRELDRMDMLVVLISPHALANDFMWDVEYPAATVRNVAVVPVLLRPCLWKGSAIEKLKILPTGGKPVARWEDRDEGILDVVMGIGNLV